MIIVYPMVILIEVFKLRMNCYTLYPFIVLCQGHNLCPSAIFFQGYNLFLMPCQGYNLWCFLSFNVKVIFLSVNKNQIQGSFTL